MSGHRWNNRFNPPLQTGAPLFPKSAVQTPSIPVNSTTRQYPGAPYVPVYTNPITQIPPVTLSSVVADATTLSVNLSVIFDYRMQGRDHFEFTITNSNTNVTTAKSYQQSANSNYSIGQFEGGTNYFIYVTPVINGLYTASSATASFASSTFETLGIIQGARVTGSGSYAIITYTNVFPLVLFTGNYGVATNDNFGDDQVLSVVSTGNQRFAIGPYTNGSSYQYFITPYTVTIDGLYKYGITNTVPSGGNYFIPGPPATPFVSSYSVSNQTAVILINTDTAFHPVPDYYQITLFNSGVLTAGVNNIASISGSIRDLSSQYAGFSISQGVLSSANYLSISTGIGNGSVQADITNDLGIWYSFRPVLTTSENGVYTFTNPYFLKPVNMSGASSFVVNFNNIAAIGNIFTLSSAISPLASVSYTRAGVTTTFGVSGNQQVITLENVQTLSYTMVRIQTFANNIFCTSNELLTFFAGAPATLINVAQLTGNRFFKWNVRPPLSPVVAQPGPRPISYKFSNVTTGQVFTTISSVYLFSNLTNGTPYNFSVTGYANGMDSIGPLTANGIVTAIGAPLSVYTTNVSNLTITLSIGRPLGGALGYMITSTGGTIPLTAIADVSQEFISATVTATTWNFIQPIVYSQDDANPPPTGYNVNLSAIGASVWVGAPQQLGAISGVYLGSSTLVSLTLTATAVAGPPALYYTISDNFGNIYNTPNLPATNRDLSFNIPNLSAYTSYQFTVRPFGNQVYGVGRTTGTFNFSPQPPTNPELFFTGLTGGTLNVRFTGATLPNPATDYYTISSLRQQLIPSSINVNGSPYSTTNINSGVLYQFAIYTTICGIPSQTYVTTSAVASGPPAPPVVSYTLGPNNVRLTISANATNAVPIYYYLIKEYYLNPVTSAFTPTGNSVYQLNIATPSITASSILNTTGTFTSISSVVITDPQLWFESNSMSPAFEYSNIVAPSSLFDLTFPNTTTLTISQTGVTYTFPITIFAQYSSTQYSYSTSLTSKTTSTIFNPTSTNTTFTWRSGLSGPFTGGTYRYDIQAGGSNDLISLSSTTGTINLYVGAPTNQGFTLSNVTATLTFSAGDASVPAQYYSIEDNYGFSTSGTGRTYTFTNLTSGSGYYYTIVAYAQGLSSANSVTTTRFAGTPRQPGFNPGLTTYGCLNGVTYVNLRSSNRFGTDPPYIPVTDICLTVQPAGSYTVLTTGISSEYNAGQGPLFTICGLTMGQTYAFTICAYANRVYSATSTICNIYMGSLPPTTPYTVSLSNVTANVNVFAAQVRAVGEFLPVKYYFNVYNVVNGLSTSLRSTSSVFGNLVDISFSAVFTGLINLSDYWFDGFTSTGPLTSTNLSYGSTWVAGIYNAGGPRPFTGNTLSLPNGSPLTQTVSLQATIATGCGGITGLWGDTTYYLTISSANSGIVTPCTAIVSNVFRINVSSGDFYRAYVYGVKNQVTGARVSSAVFQVPPTPPTSPVIVLNPVTPPSLEITYGTNVPATLTWVQSVTPEVLYRYSLCGAPYNPTLGSVSVVLSYGSTNTFSVYSTINGTSSAIVTSPIPYVYTSPPANFTYTRSSNIIGLRWDPAYQPGYSSNLTYTASLNQLTTTKGIYINSNQPIYVDFGIQTMTLDVYTQYLNLLRLGNGTPLTLTISGVGVQYDQSSIVTGVAQYSAGSTLLAYRFYMANAGSSIPRYTGTNVAVNITNISALPTNGYAIQDLLTGSVVATNIYSNNYVWTTAVLGSTYNIAVQALNSNLYSVGTDSVTGPFTLATINPSELGVYYNANDIEILWTTPVQYDGVLPTPGTNPYTWTVYRNGTKIASSQPTQLNGSFSINDTGVLSETYMYSLVTNYYGISSSILYGNQISLSTTGVVSITQTTSGFGVNLSWQAALQYVYLPESPNVVTTQYPNGGYEIIDLCGNFTGTCNVPNPYPNTISELTRIPTPFPIGGMAFGPDGNVYMTAGSGHIYMLDTSSLAISTFAFSSTLCSAQYIAFSPYNKNFYTVCQLNSAGYFDNRVMQVTWPGGVVSKFISSTNLPAYPTGIAVDPIGANIYIGSLTCNTITFYEIETSLSYVYYSNTLTNLSLNSPLNMAFGPDRNLYVANRGNANVLVITQPNTATAFSVSFGPTSVRFDQLGYPIASSGVYLQALGGSRIPITPILIANDFLINPTTSEFYLTANVSSFVRRGFLQYPNPSKYITPLLSNVYYNFAVTAIHNDIQSTRTSAGICYLGVDPVSNIALSQEGMIVTLTWSGSSIRPPNIPYLIRDVAGNRLGNSNAVARQTLSCNVPGIYSYTTLVTETISASVFGGGGGIGNGGFATSIYNGQGNGIPAGTTIVAEVGAGATNVSGGGGNSTVYIPYDFIQYLILDGGGGGGRQYPGFGYTRLDESSILVSDGGPVGTINQTASGHGSGYIPGGFGSQRAGGGSTALTNGRIELTMTAWGVSTALITPSANRSIQFSIQNNINYRFCITSWSNGLSANTFFNFNSTIAPPTDFNVIFTPSLFPANWDYPLQTPDGYFIINQYSGNYLSVDGGYTTNASFVETPVRDNTYSFKIYSLKYGIPSTIVTSTSFKVISPTPTSFLADYNGVYVNFSGFGSTYQTQLFNLTDASGTILKSNCPLNAVGAINFGNYQYAGIAGQSYTFYLYGTYNGLLSPSLTSSVTLTIPGQISLGSNPVITPSTTVGYNNLRISQCTLSADSFRVIGTNLTLSMYSIGNELILWNSVAMTDDGTTLIAVTNWTPPFYDAFQSVWTSTDSGQGWANITIPQAYGFIPYTGTVAANGSWMALFTSGGLYVNDMSNYGWTFVSNTQYRTFTRGAFSPDGKLLVVGENNGNIYTISSSLLKSVTPPFQGGGARNDVWTSIAWSRDGRVLFAVGFNDTNGFQYSLDSGINWNQYGFASRFTSISPNSNGTYILIGRQDQVIIWSGNVGNWSLFSPSGPNVLPQNFPGAYYAACSSTGAIQIAADSYSSAVYTSYDYGNNWFLDSRFVQNPNVPPGQGFSCAATSSNGFVAIALGYSTKLQTAISTPTPITTTTTYSISLDSNSIIPGNLSASVTGYNITPYLKGISGQSVFVWTTPKGGPQLYPQTGANGEYSLSPIASQRASGWGMAEGQFGYYLAAYLVAKPGSTLYSITTIDVPARQSLVLNISTSNIDPTSGLTYGFVMSPTQASDLGPGNYTFYVASAPPPAIPAQVVINIPVYTTLFNYIEGIDFGRTLTIGWSPRQVYNYTLADYTYKIYYRDNLATTVAGSSTAEIPNDGSLALIGLQTIINSISSTTITSEIIPPPAVTDIFQGGVNPDGLLIAWTNPTGVTMANVYVNDTPLQNNPIRDNGVRIAFTTDTDISVGVASVVNNIQGVVTSITARVENAKDPTNFTASYSATSPNIINLTWTGVANTQKYIITQTSPTPEISTDVFPPNTAVDVALPSATTSMEFKIQTIDNTYELLSPGTRTASVSIPNPDDPSVNPLTYSDNNPTIVTLTWSAVTGATGYNVIQRQPEVLEPPTYSLGNVLTYQPPIPSTFTGGIIEFALQTKRNGLLSSGVNSTGMTLPAPPSSSSVSIAYPDPINSPDKLTASWNAANGAQSYTIDFLEGGDLKKTKNVSGTTSVDNTSLGTSATAVSVSVYTVIDSRVSSPTTQGTTIPPNPGLGISNETNEYIEFAWNFYSGVLRYRFYINGVFYGYAYQSPHKLYKVPPISYKGVCIFSEAVTDGTLTNGRTSITIYATF